MGGFPPRMFSERVLWSPRARSTLLLWAAALPMLLMLGRAELWTQEGRWALICEQMQRSGDYWHPALLGEAYYCKPLLSYWLMCALAVVTGGIDALALRLPSVGAGLLCIWSIWRIGRSWLGAQQGLVAAGLLASCFPWVFWSRVASADMLHAAGTLFAVAWYVERRDRTDLRAYVPFALILALGSLMKSPAAALLALLAVAPDLWRERRWRRHVNWRLPVALLPAAALYVAQVQMAQGAGAGPRQQGGFAALIHENLERYFAPFDHGAPFYTYLYELPLMLAPWGLCLPWVAWWLWRRRREATAGQRLSVWAAASTFLFLLGCGSRRAYYLLPVLPFWALAIADWLVASPVRLRRAGVVATVCWLGIVAWFTAAPLVVQSMAGCRRAFVAQVHEAAAAIAPWSEWQVIACEAIPAAIFELHGSTAPIERAPDAVAVSCTEAHRELVLTRMRRLPELRAALPRARVVAQLPMPWQSADDRDLLVVLLD